ncbi:hypothetical protein GCM10023311_04880 [Flaviramulus aquimarinus]|uniref:DUF2892 domain-containing protein n=1 Tax=Flaviramulus aquimarinus TaxID=1170456 RepID=A0ABP9ETP3_9FLAO
MSTEIVIIIIGVVFVFFAFVNILKIKDSLFRSALGILGVLLIIYGGYFYESINPKGQIEQVEVEKKGQIDFPIKNIQVLSPIEGDSVNCRILTMGVYPDSHDKDIWVLLKPSDNKYYPQSDHTNTSYKKDGKWQVITRFGGDMGESFDIVVYETDSLASQYFSSTIENWKAALSYPGLKPEELPNGAHEVERIVVSLKDNCRGVF